MVKVLIERHFASGYEDTLRQVLTDLRRDARQVPGYVSGETLVDVADPLHLVVISTWNNQNDWESWYSSEERAARATPLLLLLREPERIQVFGPTEGKVWTI